MGKRARGRYNLERQYRPTRPDLLDPDNWAVIPEFGTLPAAPDFAGFALPISALKDREAAESLRAMMRTARKKIRTYFQCRAALDAAEASAVQIEFHQRTEQQRAAMAFRFMESAMATAVDPDTPEQFRIRWVAHAAAVLAAWLAGEEFTITRPTANFIGKLGGLKSGENRRKNGIDKDAVRSKAKEYGWPEQSWGIQKKLANDFGCSQAYVGRILRAEKN